jgi:diadenosine tetraphosphate (Ap4A) HIT family hydrolase
MCSCFKKTLSFIITIKKREWSDFVSIVKKLETLLKKALGASMFNWSCLLNDAYQNNPPNPHVHWHLRPRYNKKVRFNNHWFEDPDFAHHYSRDRKDEVEDIVAIKIINKIKVLL